MGTKAENGKGRRVPPSVSVVAAGGTEKGTWFVGGGHLGIWREDTIRYTGGAGYADVVMDYYGFNGGLGKHPVRFESTAFGLMQELQFRLGESHFFAGISYRLVDTQNKFDLGSVLPIPGIPALKFDSRSAGVSLSLNYDDRDNMFTPSDGLYAELKLGNYGSAWKR
ncbi:hypothetical protein [Thiolapillus sp.]|uniref:hypothetical protein n=2 Tax=Thiolapillus sp. TaxID=2017437 RepID=UPI003AF618F2